MVTAIAMPRIQKPRPGGQPYRQLGDRLRYLRGRRKQDEVARLLGISAGYVSNLESGRYQPTTDVLERYADLLGGDYNELAELAGLLRRRSDTEWTPPADVVPDLRSLAERLTPGQVKRGVRMLLEFYAEQVERDLPDVPNEHDKAESEGAG